MYEPIFWKSVSENQKKLYSASRQGMTNPKSNEVYLLLFGCPITTSFTNSIWVGKKKFAI